MYAAVKKVVMPARISVVRFDPRCETCSHVMCAYIRLLQYLRVSAMVLICVLNGKPPSFPSQQTWDTKHREPHNETVCHVHCRRCLEVIVHLAPTEHRVQLIVHQLLFAWGKNISSGSVQRLPTGQGLPHIDPTDRLTRLFCHKALLSWCALRFIQHSTCTN